MSRRVALLPGDGVGPEVIAEARRGVDALGLPIEWTELPWGSDLLPRARADDARRLRVDVLAGHDAVLLGAVGDPSVPDHVSLWGLTPAIRQRLDLWANLRPVRLLEGSRARSPAVGRPTWTCSSCARTPRASTPASAAARTRAIPTRSGSRRASSRAAASSASSVTRSSSPAARRGVLTSATKSNASRYGYVLWDEVAEEVAAEPPGRPLRARARRRAGRADGPRPGEPRRRRRLEPLRRHPHRPRRRDPGRNGDGCERQCRPGSAVPGVFEPVHGSAPDIAGPGGREPAAARSGARR